MIKTFIDILEQLETTTGTNDKIALIKENKDNLELKEFLRLALDKNVTFGIAEIDESVTKLTYENKYTNVERFKVLTHMLSTRGWTGGDAMIQIVAFLNGCIPLEHKWYKKCLQKDLASIGIGQRLFEEAYDEKGFKFRLMLAESEEELDSIDDEEGWLDKKANGVCTIIRVEDTKVSVIYGGRNGLVADSFYFLQEETEKLCSDSRVMSDCVFHGETHVNDCLENTMTLYGFKFRPMEDFIGAKGKIKEKAYADYLAKEKEVLAFKKDAKFCIFEQLTLDEWDTQTCTRDCDERKEALAELQKVITELGLKRIEIIPTEKVPNQSVAIEKAQDWIKRKFEGGIYKRSSGFYEWKRSRNSIKIKEVVDFEIEFDSFEIQKKKHNPDGTLKPPMAGKVWGHDLNGNQYKIGTGKALSEAVRIDMLNNWDTNYKGKIGTCSAQRPSEKGKYICARLDIIRLDRNSLED
jgi:hypothetical protein